MLEEEGNVLLMFPEGTRSVDGRVGMFRRGVGLLLAGTPFLAVPCYLDGTFKAWPKGSLIPRLARVRLSIGRPRAYEHIAQDEHGALEICAGLRSAVLSLAPQSRPQPARPISKEAYI
jgi:1-acyl-sn-glycerol-3-phosphate acyltransferase